MNYPQFADLIYGIEKGVIVRISEPEAYALIDMARSTGTPLSPVVKGKISAALNDEAPLGWERFIDGTGRQIRIAIRKKGKQLPSESGDQTP